MSEDRSIADLIHQLRVHRLTIGCAESLTGGLLTARLVDVPGASAVVRGGIVAYATDLKSSLLGVEPRILDQLGPVSRMAAQDMALGARTRLGADIGLSTTGVAGPGMDPSAPGGPIPAGTVFVAASSARGGQWRALALEGDRDEVRRASVEAAIDVLWELLATSWNIAGDGGVRQDDDDEKRPGEGGSSSERAASARNSE